MIICTCGYRLTESAIVCPRCETVVQDPAGLKRKTENRPVETKTVSCYNGIQVRQLRDGSLVCTCHDFLLQKDTGADTSPSCRHIRDYIRYNLPPEITAREPSDWQILLLKTLGANVNYLTNDQAYYLVAELLQLRGITYPEMMWFLKNQKKPTHLPLIPYDLEIKGGIRDKAVFEQRLVDEASLPVAGNGYSSANDEWHISANLARSSGGFTPVGLVTPKLLGDRGLQQLKKALDLWNAVGAKHDLPGSGVHVRLYLDETENTMEFHSKFASNYAKAERQYLWYLVPPSRRASKCTKPLDESFFTTFHQTRDRQYSLKISEGNVEVRLLNCTTNPLKVSAWITLLLRLYEATKSGLTHTAIPNKDFAGFLTAIGFDKHACRALMLAKAYLIKSYGFWQMDAAKHPDHIPNLPPLALDDVDAPRQEENIPAVERRRRQAI
jgi:hypothetical protein